MRVPHRQVGGPAPQCGRRGHPGVHTITTSQNGLLQNHHAFIRTQNSSIPLPLRERLTRIPVFLGLLIKTFTSGRL